MATRPKVGEQAKLALKPRNWGGKRAGAGRKPKGVRPTGVLPASDHLKRETFDARFPVHVTIRMMESIWNLRSERSFAVLAQAIGVLRGFEIRLTHYSVQGNHLHMILELDDPAQLARAMRSFGGRIAKGLNKLMARKGRVLADRYHVQVLRNPTQVRNAIKYVLENTRKHMFERGDEVGAVTFDAYAAGPVEHVPATMRLRPSTLLDEPRTFLLRAGWTLASQPPRLAHGRSAASRAARPAAPVAARWSPARRPRTVAPGKRGVEPRAA